MADKDSFRQLPAIDRLLRDDAVAPLIAAYGRDAVRDALRNALDAARAAIRAGDSLPDPASLLSAAERQLSRVHTLRAVINATGVIIHTNLGRAPLSEAAQAAILAVAGGYSTLEYQLEEGERGRRDIHPEALIKAVTGAEAALVVNNNAAAVTLILAALAKDREVVISRGQLVEIGGGFRMPDVMARSGARLREVGTTNRTRLDDFASAMTPETAMVLRVHASNFKQIGFTSQPSPADLARLAHERGLIAADDLGSGALLDTAAYGLDHEPTVQESLRDGFDLVAFSGDKLLGGPQAGIIAGRADLVAQLKKHPLARALRIDKLCLAALVATLEHYRRGEDEVIGKIPVWRMIATSPDAIRTRADAWAAHVGGVVIPGQSAVGGGSLPGEVLPTYLLALDPPDSAQAFAARLRRATPLPIIARIADERVLLDPRTVQPGQDEALIAGLRQALSGP